MRIGDKVVCIADQTNWIDVIRMTKTIGPHPKEVLIVEIVDCNGYLAFYKYPDLAVDGTRHFFCKTNFHRIEPNFTNTLTKELSDDFIKEDDLVIEIEKELTE